MIKFNKVNNKIINNKKMIIRIQIKMIKIQKINNRIKMKFKIMIKK